jgi:DNA polymerase III alpha subunit
MFDITVYPPCLKEIYNGDRGKFAMVKDKIFFGISDIKGIGESNVEKIFTNVENVSKQIGRNISDWTWYDFLIFFSNLIGSTTVINLIATGATDYMGGSRNHKIHEYNMWIKTTKTEKEWIKNTYNKEPNLISILYNMLENKPKMSDNRKQKVLDIINKLENPSFSLQDDAYFIARHEHELLGIPLTCSKLDACHDNVSPDTTCKELLSGKSGNFLIRVEIIGANEYIIKRGKLKGKTMMFLQVEDDTASMDSLVVFPDLLEENRPLLINGSTVLLGGKKDTKYHKESFVVESIVSI